jgi:hypothetical protein
MSSAFSVVRHVYDMTDEELLNQYLRMAPWWKASDSERAPIREEILRRMKKGK